MSPAQQVILRQYRFVRRQGVPPLAASREIAHVAATQLLLQPTSTVLQDRLRVADQWRQTVLVRELARLTPRVAEVTS